MRIPMLHRPRGIGFLTTFGAILGVAFVGDAMAAQDAADLAENVMDQLSAIENLLLALFFLVGVVLFGTGLYLFWKDSKETGRGHAKNGAIALAIGTLLLALTTLIGVFATSIFGSDGENSLGEGSSFTDF